MPKKKVVLFEHYNVDSIQTIRQYKQFNKFCNSFNHIVFAPYIKDYLIDIGVQEDKVFYVPHPLFNANVPAAQRSSDRRTMLCPGNSNEEDILKAIVDYEEQYHILEQNQINMILRIQKGSMLCSSSKNISFWQGYVSAEEYERKYNDADGILITYPTSYKYRFASVILNALTKHKIVYGNDVMIVQYFAEKYPKNCYCFSSIQELFSQIVDAKLFDEAERDQFMIDNSEVSVMKALRDCLEWKN